MIKLRQASLVLSAAAALASTGAVYAGGFDGNYSTSFSFKMSNDSLCPNPLPIRLSVTVVNSRVSGTIQNNGGGNANSFCALYHNGSISGNVDASGNLSGVAIAQRDAHSAQYSSYALIGNLSGSVSLISRSKKFHPTVSFQLARSGGVPATTNQPSVASASDAPQTGYDLGRGVFLSLSVVERNAVQEALKSMNLYSGSIDGKWGRGTYAAVKDYLSDKAETVNNFTLAYAELNKGEELPTAPQENTIVVTEISDEEQVTTTLEYAQALIGDVEAFVASGQADFDIGFAKKYAEVSEIKSGSFSTELVSRLMDFEEYVSSSDAFRKYRASRELDRVSALRAEISGLKTQISGGYTELTTWVRKNLLDPQSASVVEVAEAAQKAAASDDDVELLREVAEKIELTKAKIGLLKQDTAPQTPQITGDPDKYTSDAVYLLGNFSGNGEHIYKNLSGSPEFDKGKATACLIGALDQWERLSVSSALNENFNAKNLDIKLSDCRGAEDLVIAKGAELNAGTIPASFNISTLEEILVIEQKSIFEEKNKLQIASELYESDILNGSKIGHGLVIFNDSSASLCLILEGNKDDHLVALEESKKVLSTFIEFTGGYALADDAIDAFKRIQRNDCGAIYADAVTLAKLIEAAKNNNLGYLVAPAWVTPNAIQDIAVQREANEKALAAQREALKQNEVLQEQASVSAAEKAIVLQLELRNRHDVRFSALVDDLSGKLKTAVDFAFSNSPLDKGYQDNYLTLPILDPIEPTKSAFDPIIEDIQRLSLEKWEMTGFIVEKIDYGDVSYNNRVLEGVIVELNISVKNRVVGDFSTYCQVIRAVQDDDFDMLRQISIEACEADHSEWKIQNGFESKWIVNPN